MYRTRACLITVPMLAAAALCGCSPLTSCPEPPQELMEAREVPSVTVPLGLEQPDTSGALRIPELEEPERPRNEEAGCLDRPPSYFPDRRPGAEREDPAG